MGNNMQKVLDLINEIQGTELKMDEPFKLTDDLYYRFTENGLEVKGNALVGGNRVATRILEQLMLGEIKIKKTKWKPASEEKYYYAVVHRRKISSNEWLDDDIDNWMYQSGLCFRTEDEAQKMFDKILDYVKKEREHE